MTYLNELKSGDFARVVEIKNVVDINNLFVSKGLLEGSFIKIISCFGNIVFESNKKIYVISKGIAERIRVIHSNITI